MKKIKLLFIIHSLDVGGAEGQLYELVTRLDKKRYEPAVCSLTGNGPYVARLRKQGVPVLLLAPRLRNVPTKLKKLFDFMRQERFDIVQNVMFTAGVFGTLVARCCNVPVVVNSVRSLGFLHFHYRRPIKRFLYKMSDCVIANSELMKSHLIRRRIAPESKIRTIYNGVDIERFSNDKQDQNTTLRNALGIKTDNFPLVGMVASLSPVKNHQCLLKAIPSILEEFPRAAFLLIGDGSLKESLQKSAESRGIERSIFFLGERKDIPDLFKLVDFSVLCSFREGFSNVVLESMACGTPVIATNVGGNPEAVIDESTGFLFEADDHQNLAAKMILLAKNQNLRQQMGLAARKRVEDFFNTKYMVKIYEDLYQSLLANSPFEGWGRREHLFSAEGNRTEI
jgi:glycosyltransferase involved in cell wall biosynthesis